mgnify:CR=1 FL=1
MDFGLGLGLINKEYREKNRKKTTTTGCYGRQPNNRIIQQTAKRSRLGYKV